MELPAPGLIGELAIFLLPGAEIPASCGGDLFAVISAPAESYKESPRVVTVNYCFPPYTGWDVLGVLTSDAPSAIFRTNWPSTPDFAAAPVVQVQLSSLAYFGLPTARDVSVSMYLTKAVMCQIGLSIESADVVGNLKQVLRTSEQDKLGFATLVARDLFRCTAPYRTGRTST